MSYELIEAIRRVLIEPVGDYHNPYSSKYAMSIAAHVTLNHSSTGLLKGAAYPQDVKMNERLKSNLPSIGIATSGETENTRTGKITENIKIEIVLPPTLGQNKKMLWDIFRPMQLMILPYALTRATTIIDAPELSSMQHLQVAKFELSGKVDDQVFHEETNTYRLTSEWESLYVRLI